MTTKSKTVRFSEQVEIKPLLPPQPLVGSEKHLHEDDTEEAQFWLPEAAEAPPDCTIRAALSQLIQIINSKGLTDKFILIHLKGIVELYSPLIYPTLVPTKEPYPDQAASAAPVSQAIKLKIAQETGLRDPVMSASDPIIGLTIYVGSPTDGHMILYNEALINQWLTFTRAAIKDKVIQISNDLLSIDTLAALFDVLIIPGKRHAFEIQYGRSKECDNHINHTRLQWVSPKYPCSITSCRLP